MGICTRLSRRSIFQAIYLQARGELRQEIKRAMRQGRATRKPRFRESMVMISERPTGAEDRAAPGHWEGDLITGTRNQSAMDWLQCIRQSDEGRMTWDWRPTMADPKHPRHYDEAFKRQIVQS